MSQSSAIKASTTFQFSLDGVNPGHFKVRKVIGKEAMSEAYSFKISLSCPADGSLGGEDQFEIEQGMLGQKGIFLINTGKSSRALYGVVSAVRLKEVHLSTGELTCEINFVPRLWLLKKKVHSRIFQNLRVPDIVTQVLGEMGIGTRWQLMREYPTREYCVQYEESDYRFLQRILAEAGIYFYFPQGPATSGGLGDLTSVIGLAANAAASAATSMVGSVAGSAAGATVGSLISAAASAATPLIPGDTLVFGDDAAWYPPIGADDPAELAAASAAAAIVPDVTDALASGLSTAGSDLGMPSGATDLAVAAASNAVNAAVGGAIAAIGSKPPPLLYFTQMRLTGDAEFDKVTQFVLTDSVRSNSANYRDYDPQRPRTRFSNSAVSSAPFPPTAAEIAASATAAAADVINAIVPDAISGIVGAVEDEVEKIVTATAGLLEDYRHDAQFLFPKWTGLGNEAPKILRQKRRRASIATGESACPDLAVGHRFALANHPASHLDAAYVVTAVEHRGSMLPEDDNDWLVYRNTFECAPASVTYVPPRPKRKSVQVSLTATVVGPPGEEIWVDPMGQIKVQFHWDREGCFDDQSSCWIRTMHPWAGAGWGAQFIPRVGMEVMVSFLGGDPDCPVVIGSLYNATHPTPFLLPQDKTRSGWRSQSSPGGAGFNEISLEDAAGAEQLTLIAQRDHYQYVKHDHFVQVGNNQSTAIGVDQTEQVGRNRTEQVGADVRLDVGRNMATNVAGALATKVQGSHIEATAGDRALNVAGSFSSIIGNAASKGSSDTFVFNNYTVGADGNIRLRAAKSVRLECGDSAIELTPSGINISASSISVSGGKSINASGGGARLRLGGDADLMACKVRIISQGASLALNENAFLDGTTVQLNCNGLGGGGDDPTAPPVPTKNLSLKFSDQTFTAQAGRDYVITAGGAKFEGKTDGSGQINLDVPADAETADVIVWTGERPNSPTMQYLLKLQDIPGAEDVTGLQVRLKNLGYLWGEPTGQLDPQTQRALRAFQTDHQLDPTAQHDGKTAQAVMGRSGV